MRTLSRHYDLAIFTAAEQVYADLILQRISQATTKEPAFQFKYKKYREHCQRVSLGKRQFLVKNLDVFLDYGLDLNNVVIIDNLPVSYIKNKQNGIPIKSFYGEPDRELFKLLHYLLTFDPRAPLASQNLFHNDNINLFEN